MSLRPNPCWPHPRGRRSRAPPFPRAPLSAAARRLGTIYDDKGFVAFSRHGRPAEAPGAWRWSRCCSCGRAADRQAADAVRDRLAWKYLLGLDSPTPASISPSLSDFRARLVGGGAEQVLLDALLERCKAVGLVKARGKQRTDSTHVLAAVRALNRVECVGETLRHALDVLAVVAPEWLRAQAPRLVRALRRPDRHHAPPTDSGTL